MQKSSRHLTSGILQRFYTDGWIRNYDRWCIVSPLPQTISFLKLNFVTDSRRGEPTLREPIELLIVDETSTDPIPTPPHPSTLIPPSSRKPTRLKLPFSQYYMKNEAKANSVLLREFIRPLERRGVVSDMTTPGTNVWQGWVRVPKKNGESWETSRDRLRGIEKVNGEFHRVNIT